jgi:hypothetical protein
VACIVLSARIPDILIRIAPVARLCMLLDPSYVLVKSSKGDVYAKFVGKKNDAHISNNGIGTKRESIWVPKALVTNLQGPKQVWVPKRN